MWIYIIHPAVLILWRGTSKIISNEFFVGKELLLFVLTTILSIAFSFFAIIIIITLKSNSEILPNSVSICVLSSMLSMALNSASILVRRIYISRLLSSVSVPLSPLPMCNFIAFSTSMFCCAVLRMASCRTPSSIVGDSWQYFLPKSSFGLAFFSLETFRNNFLNSDTDNYQKLGSEHGDLYRI